MLFIALATSTLPHYAMVILIPFLAEHDHKSMKSFEIGILIAAATAGSLSSSRFTEPLISMLGTKWTIQTSFLLMVVASFAMWLVTYITNDSEFMTLCFVSRFLFGFGSGLLREVILIARALGKKNDK